MKFSVVTCTWNSEAYLKQCIESVQQQTYQNIEHIFIDGECEDRTLEIIKSSPIEKKICHGVRGGISHAINSGIELADGEIVVHLHSDDSLAHERVSRGETHLQTAQPHGYSGAASVI